MSKSTLIETQNSQTEFENNNKNNSGILGHLKGVFADYKNGTRNSDRLYSEELWDNRVFGSEDVMEALETKTLFGELDHPDGDRCETLAKNAAISIIKLEKKPDEGVIYGEAEILDTPTGRIVKALADSGAKLGISSRGMGEEIYVDGQNIIDPETYDFITFDVVVTPANTKARVSLTENKKFNKLTENLKKEILESETENQLNQIKTVINNSNLVNKDELNGLVESRLTTFNKPNKVATKLSEANRRIALELLKSKYNSVKSQLSESVTAAKNLADENEKLIADKTFLENSRITLKGIIKENNSKIEELNNTNKELNSTNKELKDKVSKLTQVKEELDNITSENEKLKDSRVYDKNNYQEIMLRSKQVNNKKISNLENKLNKKIEQLQKENNEKNDKIDKLNESLAEKENKITEYSKILVENKKLLARVKMLENKELESKNKLAENKSIESSKIKMLENQLKQLKLENSKLNDTQDRFSKLAFNPMGTIKAVTENFNTNSNYDADDIALYNTLVGK